MITLSIFLKSVFAHIFAKFEYFTKVITYSKSPVTYFKMIHNTFIFLKFEFFLNSRSGAIAEPFRENCSYNRKMKIFFQYLK